MGLIAKQDVVGPPNKAPEWTGTPAPVVSEGSSANYDLSQNTFDAEGDTLQYHTATASNAFPAWMTLSSAGVLAITSAAPAGETTGIYINVHDGTNAPVTSPAIAVEITGAISSATLESYGYSLVDSFGADPTGVNDSREAIEAAWNASFKYADSPNSGKPIVFTAGGTYRITDTLRFGTFHPGRENDMRGSVLGLGGDGTGVARPKIVLDDGLPAFDTGTLRPVVCFRHFVKGATDWPTDPLDSSGTNEGKSNEAFRRFISNIDIDCGINPDAVGLYMPVAQGSFASEMEIDVSRGNIGIWGALGRNCVMQDITIIGGRTQIRNASMNTGEGCVGVVFAGLKLVGDSRLEQCITQNDVIPFTIVGGDITISNQSPFVVTEGDYSTGAGHISLTDVEFNANGGTIINNASGQSLSLRNVYYTGTNSFLLNPSGAGNLTGNQDVWNRIVAYGYCDQTTTDANNRKYTTRNMVDGVIDTDFSGVASTSASVAAPPDFISRHTIRLPRVDQGAYINVVDNGATITSWGSTNFVNAEAGFFFGDDQGSGADGATGSRDAIQTSIASASAAGHNRVFIPGGVIAVSSPGIALSSSTVLFGTDWVYTAIVPHYSWVPSSATATPVIESADSSTGTAHLSQLRIVTPGRRGDNVGGGYSFARVHWRTGKNSSTVLPANDRQNFTGQTTYNYNNSVTYNTKISGNGGGKHYSHQDRRTILLAGNNSRNLLISSTSAPLHIYGINLEATKNVDSSYNIDTNIEIESAKNVRIYNCKREGRSPTALINDSQNIGLFGFGRQQDINGNDNYLIRVQGSSDNIGVGLCTWDKSSATTQTGMGMVEEQLSAQSLNIITWPEGVSIYLRGTLDDSLVEI